MRRPEQLERRAADKPMIYAASSIPVEDAPGAKEKPPEGGSQFRSKL
jgi:hypothetical protein